MSLANIWIFIFSCFFPFAVQAAESLTISTLSTLSFGKIAAGTGGSVTISPSGSRTKSGGVTILSSASGSTAIFHLKGPAGQAYILTLPANNEVTLVSQSNSLNVTNFTVSPSAVGALSFSGDQTVTLGATLNIDSNKQPGDYSSSFSFAVDYQ